MPYTFTITEVTPTITATVYASTISVTVENIGFTITETTQNFALTNVFSTTTIYENAVELKVDDFDNYFMGNWSSSGVYRRGDLVNYNYSLYVSDINTGTTYTNNAGPDVDTTKWRRVVWHEAPFAYATVTDYLYVGGATTLHNTEIRGNLTLGGGAGVQGLTVNSTATFNGRAYFNNTATFSGDIEFNNNTLVVPKLRVTGTSTFQDRATFQGAEFNNSVQFNGIGSITVDPNIYTILGGQVYAGYISIGTNNDGRSSSINHNLNVNDTSHFYKLSQFDQGISVTGRTTSTEFIGNTATVDYILPRTQSRITLGHTTITNANINFDLSVGTSLNVGTTSSFVGNSRFKSDVTVDKNVYIGQNLAVTGTISASTLTSIRFVTDQFNLAGLEYPSNKGLYGQVLTTNGSTTATWVNLGDLTAWSLNEDLYTNGYDIKTGYPVAPLVTPVPDLTIYRGDSTHDFGHIRFDRRHSLPANNPYTGTVYQDYQDIEIAAPSRLTLMVGDNDVWGSTASIIIQTTTTASGIQLRGDVSGANGTDPVRISSHGIRYSDGTVQTTAVPAVTVPVASAVTTGSVRIDTTYLTIAADGLLGVNTNNVLTQLVTATNTRLGGVKIGSGLNIDGTGLLSLNTNSVVTITTQVTSSTIESYFFSTSTTYVITNEVGKLNLVQDAFTNGYAIAHSAFNYNYLRLGDTDSTLNSSRNLTLSADNSVRINSGKSVSISPNNTATISSKQLIGNLSENIIFTVSQGTQTSSITVNPDNIELLAKTVINFLAPLVSIGTQTSVTQIGQLRVDKIYNYEGTFAPFFPAGVQFNDNTVQRTAFEPDQGLIGG